MNKRVAIVWRYLPDYRVAFYRGLREYLLQRNIDLQLIYGRTAGYSGNGETEGAVPWAKYVKHWSVTIGGIEVCWQPYCRYIHEADLVIFEQANRLLLNYWLIAKRGFSRQKIAFWGHGRDLQTSPRTLRNAWKNVFLKHVDWWFAYTRSVKEEVVKSAFPAGRITIVQNTIDTTTLLRARAKISARELQSVRNGLGLGVGPVGIYCGRMYKKKRIEFLLETCRRVREQIPSFELVVIGRGEEEGKVISAARNWRWLHYVGPKYGDERIPFLLLSDVFLMPGAVGLAIIDCFALEVPLMTTKFPYHGPELSYLKNGENGLMTVDDLESYVAGVSGTLVDREGLERLKSGCRAAASIYTMERMVENFGGGIIACLDT
jgi:glycosyltransferase involved in cell wall biosynthesis